MEEINKISIVDEIKVKINELKDKIKEQGVSSALFEELSKNTKLLQDKLNELLSKTILTQSDVNDAYMTLQNVKRNELALDSKKSKRKALIYLGLGVLVIYGIYKLTKK